MADMLTHIARTKARFAILDLTGVEIVDSATANHLLKLIQAMRLLGAEGIVTGLRPSVARTMISLGIDLKSVVTLTNLREGLHRCIRLMRDERAIEVLP
jgi:rsbT co-antagonist protein RsbR